ncbi:MAG: DegT/DnrJ/EryC1/StrS family aminotransferase [Prevotellaceae bacterium]|jgi:dTDP-4-amino-4,6-dideoxygalactose transaminase|nr:DegT/DnrJ/EryC1/StrS family aminotransferase [Prevotellaceae bacterium]
MNTNRIWLSLAHMGGREQEFIQQAFETNWITSTGPNVDGFEQSLETFLGNGVHVAAVISGTAALHLSLILLGVKPDDEVICQSFTFSASCNPICYQGAVPVFVDSEKDTWNISPEFLEAAICARIKKGKKPKAIIPVHLYGMPAKMKEILSIANHYEIPVVEDAAEALGSMYGGMPCGTLGEMAVLSFNGNKIITTSGGGALVSNNEEYCTKARFLATQARDAAPYYQHSQIGYNYRMSNIVAGIGRGQMQVLPDRILRRRSNNQFYRNCLAGIDGITFQNEPAPAFYSNYWLTTIIVDSEKTGGITCEDLRLALENANIESRPLWKPMHLQQVFSHYPYYGENVCEKLFDTGLCLPSGSLLTEDDLKRVADVIRTTLRV